MSALSLLLLFAVGTIASVFGALAGLGGAFLVLPVMRLLGVPAETAAAAALAMALANAASASFEYHRQRRIDHRVAGLFALTGVPASILGAYVVQFVNGRSFDVLLGSLYVIVAGSLIWRLRLPPAARGAAPARTATRWEMSTATISSRQRCSPQDSSPACCLPFSASAAAYSWCRS